MVQGSKGQNGIYYLNQFGPVPLIFTQNSRLISAQIAITLWISEEI